MHPEWVSELMQGLAHGGHLKAFGGSEFGWGSEGPASLPAYPLLSNPPSEEPVTEETPESYQDNSALSPALIIKKPFGKMKGPSCWKQRRGTWSLVPKGKGKLSLWWGQPQIQADRCWQISIPSHRPPSCGSEGSFKAEEPFLCHSLPQFSTCGGRGLNLTILRLPQ